MGLSSGNVVIVVLVSLLFSGCAGRQTSIKSSVVDYLYPQSTKVLVEPSIPELKLPIKLGIAFVPEQSATAGGSNYWTGRVDMASALTEAKKTIILEKIAEHFKQYKFIGEIQLIPSPYLTPGGSFTNLEQIKTMYGIDVIALISYDQIQFTDEDLLSISYWTVIGAYMVSGEKNDTNTLMDTVVYDIASKKMLFRAPGTSLIKGRSTVVNHSEELRADSIRGFEKATQVMIENLDNQLVSFREKAKHNPDVIKLIKTSGYSGGGTINIFMMCIAALCLVRVKKE